MKNVSGYRKERLDRGIKARVDDIFAISTYREILYMALPRILFIIFLLALPLLGVFIGSYWQGVISATCVIALISLSWAFMFSVGLISLGHAVFFGLGAYIAGWLSSSYGLTPLVTIPVASLVGSAMGALLLYPVLRLRGIYFTLITFALPLFMFRVIEATGLLGGTSGISGVTAFPSRLFATYLIVIALLIVLFTFLRIQETDYGLVLRAIKDNDLSVYASGINVPLFKAQALFIGGLPAVFAGAYLTHYYRFVGMTAFALENSLFPITSAVIGGIGLYPGAVLGAFILSPMSESLRAFGTLRIVIYSMLLIVFIVRIPEGIFRLIQRKYFQFERWVPLERREDNE
jgi:branched-chain amino acid transport system permease protein